MRFEEWLVQQKYRTDEVGHFARNYIADGCVKSFNEEYLIAQEASEDAMSIFKLAQREYNILQKNPNAMPRSPRLR